MTHRCARRRGPLDLVGLLSIACVAGAVAVADASAAEARKLEPQPGWIGSTLDNLPCVGPDFRDIPAVDYRHADRRILAQEERAHFPSKYEQLVGDAAQLMQNFNFMLAHWPNHHRILWAMIRLALREHAKYLPMRDRQMYPECYLQRALKFRPDDGSVWLLYGLYLHRTGHRKAALDKYEQALQLMPKSSEAHYDIGLLYLDMKKFDKAREHAKRAYALGYPLPGLRDRLKRAGHWK